MYYEDSLEPAGAGRPEGVPEKFWDANTGRIRTDALMRAYLDLEQRMHRMVRVPGPDSNDDEVAGFRRAMGIPEAPDGYTINHRHELFASDGEINQRLHEAGFTPAQAQLVYDLAHDRVLPLIEEIDREYQTRRGLDRLRDHFGGDSRWNETARQVSAWGQTNLPPEIYQALAQVPEGVIAMSRMMASGEPGLGSAPGPRDEMPDEAELKKMMQDPRYWKKKDPAFIEKVSAGFRRIYGE
ncbi:hypothetical protein [Magnetospirillum sp. UT-4]|uniref:capsid assembly protein n=1 Tax=Magnetospirillum sp. UT-4 TaxID=2681467 RepID=UPI0013847174|nr:hypothetical protein [Magnetospirillum sp. UT-4]CAA7617636.1 conserved hypothetical protein [Magnetospirillum sp. UT-4]